MKLKKVLCVMMMLGVTAAQLFGTQSGKAVSASTKNQTQEIGVLGDWEKDKECPDFYGGLRYDNDTDFFIVYLKENTSDNQQVVLDGCPAIKDIIKFQGCKYSRNELKVVNDELSENYSNYKGLQTWGITIPYGDSLNYIDEPRVLAGIYKDNYTGTAELLKSKFGDKIITYAAGKLSTLDLEETNGSKSMANLTITFKSVKHKGNKIKIKWKKLSKASKYKVAIYNKKGKKLIAKTVKKCSFTYKIKKKSKKYTIKVKAYNKGDKKWGSWTKETIN